VGAGIQGSTTTAVGADIVAFAASRGLFGGVALEGSVMSTDTQANQAYYGQPLAARQLVMQMQGNNPGADPLRDVLTRYGSGAAMRATVAPQQQPGYAPPYNSYQPQGARPTETQGGFVQDNQGYPPPGGGRGPVQEQNLAPPR
jgi:hypothetical protein